MLALLTQLKLSQWKTNRQQLAPSIVISAASVSEQTCKSNALTWGDNAGGHYGMLGLVKCPDNDGLYIP